MDANKYQELAMRTAGQSLVTDDLAYGLTISALGLTGEAGEVADLVKKHLYHGHPLDRDKLIKEAGDVAWYLARLATALEMPLGEILHANIEKLMLRYPEGFTVEDSLNRRDNG
jgi:NTP pyrophosphatase (non-canonical NTP hydrolase)